MSSAATWVYAVTPGIDPAVLDDLAGIGGAPVRDVRADGLAAAASSVDAAAFGEEALQRRLADPGELEALVRAHHHVIGAVAAAGPVLPLRLATVYHGDDGVRSMLAGRRPQFTETLEWLTGRAECGVKVWASRAALAEPPPTGDAGPEPGRGGGAAYLSRRRAELAARDEGQRRAAETGTGIHETLSGLAVAACQHQPHDAAAADQPAGTVPEVMVLNGAYLVGTAGLAAFAAAAEAAVAGRDGCRVAVTGPWPPYSFAGGPGEEP
jgi:hypothetical protein